MRAALLAILLTGCATWDRTDRALFAVGLTCHAADYLQTESALESGYTELNPLLGKDPSELELLLTKATGLGVTWIVAEAAATYRTEVLALTLLPCVAAVAHNHGVGARIEF